MVLCILQIKLILTFIGSNEDWFVFQAQTQTKSSRRRIVQPAGWTDSSAGQGPITTVSASTAVSKWGGCCFDAPPMQQCQCRRREGDKLKTCRESDARNETKGQNDGCLWRQGLRLSLPVIFWVQMKEERACVCVCAWVVSILAIVVASLPIERTLEVMLVLVTPMTVYHTHL